MAHLTLTDRYAGSAQAGVHFRHAAMLPVAPVPDLSDHVQPELVLGQGPTPFTPGAHRFVGTGTAARAARAHLHEEAQASAQRHESTGLMVGLDERSPALGARCKA